MNVYALFACVYIALSEFNCIFSRSVVFKTISVPDAEKLIKNTVLEKMGALISQNEPSQGIVKVFGTESIFEDSSHTSSSKMIEISINSKFIYDDLSGENSIKYLKLTKGNDEVTFCTALNKSIDTALKSYEYAPLKELLQDNGKLYFEYEAKFAEFCEQNSKIQRYRKEETELCDIFDEYNDAISNCKRAMIKLRNEIRSFLDHGDENSENISKFLVLTNQSFDSFPNVATVNKFREAFNILKPFFLQNAALLPFSDKVVKTHNLFDIKEKDLDKKMLEIIEFLESDSIVLADRSYIVVFQTILDKANQLEVESKNVSDSMIFLGGKPVVEHIENFSTLKSYIFNLINALITEALDSKEVKSTLESNSQKSMKKSPNIISTFKSTTRKFSLDVRYILLIGFLAIGFIVGLCKLFYELFKRSKKKTRNNYLYNPPKYAIQLE